MNFNGFTKLTNFSESNIILHSREITYYFISDCFLSTFSPNRLHIPWMGKIVYHSWCKNISFSSFSIGLPVQLWSWIFNSSSILDIILIINDQSNSIRIFISNQYIYIIWKLFTIFQDLFKILIKEHKIKEKDMKINKIKKEGKDLEDPYIGVHILWRKTFYIQMIDIFGHLFLEQSLL